MKKILSTLATLLLVAAGMAQNATLPYRTGFEVGDDTAWNFFSSTSDGGTIHASWCINNYPSTSNSRALQIVSNYNTTEDYSLSAHAWRGFTVDHSGDYVISFDVRAFNWTDFFSGSGEDLFVELLADTLILNTPYYEADYLYNSNQHWYDSSWTNIEIIRHLEAGDTGRTFYILVTYACASLESSSINHFNPVIDNISFHALTCPAPTDLTLDSVATDALFFYWTPGGNETVWDVRVGERTGITYHPSVGASDLEPATWYDVSVRAICGVDDSSIWLTRRFNTMCPLVDSLPFNMNLRNFDITNPCWVFDGGIYSFPSGLRAIGTNSETSQPTYALMPRMVYNTENMELGMRFPGYTTQNFIVGLVDGDHYDSTITLDTVATINLARTESPSDTNISFSGHDMQGKRIALIANNNFLIDSISLHQSATNSIDMAMETIGMTIYPNPAASDITVNIATPAIVTLFNIQGHTIVPPTHVTSTLIIERQTLKPGFYFVQAVTKHGTTTSKITVR